jgi:hypothetical protein
MTYCIYLEGKKTNIKKFHMQINKYILQYSEIYYFSMDFFVAIIIRINEFTF